MRKLVKATSLLTFVSVGDMVLRFIRTKTVAMLLGKEGTGFLAQLTLLFELLRVWGDLGARRSVIKQVAEAKAADPSGVTYRRVVGTSFKVNICASVALAAGVMIFSPEISRMLYGRTDYYLYVAAVALILPFSAFATLVAAIMKGNLFYADFARTTLGAFFCVLLTIPAIHFFGMWGAVAVLFCYAAFPLFAYLAFNRRKPFLNFGGGFDRPVFSEQLRYGAIDIYGMSFIGIARLVVAAVITKSMGLEAMGLYQVVLAFSYSYMTILIQAVTGYTLPSIAGAKTNEESVKAINDTVRFVLFVISPVIISLVTFPELYIHLFYNDSFVGAARPLQIQLVGTMLAMMTAALQPWFLAKRKFVPLVVSSTISPLIFVVFSTIWVGPYGLNGVAAAAVMSSLSVLAFEYGYLKFSASLAFDPKNLRLIAATAVWMAVAIAAGTLSVETKWRAGAFLLCIPWFFFSSKNHERTFLWSKIKSRIGLGAVTA